jgi:hypothetical protein
MIFSLILLNFLILEVCDGHFLNYLYDKKYLSIFANLLNPPLHFFPNLHPSHTCAIEGQALFQKWQWFFTIMMVEYTFMI